MKFLLILCAVILGISGCDDSGETAYYPPVLRDTIPTLQLTDTTDVGVEPDLLQTTNNELRINLAQIAGAGQPTRVVITADLEDGEIIGYSVTTSSRKKSAPAHAQPKQDLSCANCYIIVKGDTRTSLAKKFGVKPSQIKNKTINIGQKLIIE